METEQKRGSFTGSIGFVLAAAGSAVGLGNIWRFPYLAAKDNGGVFLLCYVVLALTFGFALLTTEVAIGRKTQQGPLTAYGRINRRWGFLGIFGCLVPTLILPYYCAIGGWVFKYFTTYATWQAESAAGDTYFTGFITGWWEPLLFMLAFLLFTAVVVFTGVDKGIEKLSKFLMPALVVLVVGISIYSLTISHTDEATGETRTGIDGLLVYIIPNFSGMTLQNWFTVVMDAMGQLFFSISVAMGIMIAYGSYMPKKTNLMRSINEIEIFDTVIAILSGMMIVPAVIVFMGQEGMTGGPGLMFISLPKVFYNGMGHIVGSIIGILFFLMVSFAALTSSISIMEAIVSSLIDRFRLSRQKAVIIVSLYALVVGVAVCFGYNLFYFEMPMPNDPASTGQILDILDYITNNCIMPLLALLTCILIGWVAKPKTVIDEVCEGNCKFRRRHLYVIMIKFVAPVLLFALLMNSVGLMHLIGL